MPTQFLTEVLREIDSHFKPVLVEERFPQADVNEKYKELFREAMRGEGDFWPTGPGANYAPYQNAPKWDNEQAEAMFSALCRAVRMVGATPAEKWARVEMALRNTVHVYADAKS